MNKITKIITATILVATFFFVTYAVDSEQDKFTNKVLDVVKELAIEVGELKEGAVVGGDSTLYVGGGSYKLANSISSSDTSIVLQKFTVPVSDYELSMNEFGDIGYMTLDPGTSKREFISFTGVSQDSGSTKATLSGVTRGLSFVSPYTASSSLVLSHSGGSRAIISNSPQLYDGLATKNNDESITGIWQFDTELPRSSITATTTQQFTTKGYVDNSVNQGASTSTEAIAGISELATQLQMASSTDLGADNPLVVQAKYSTSTTEVRGIYNIISQASGYLKQSWLDLTEAFTWTGYHTFDQAEFTNASTTYASTTYIGLNGIDYIFPSVEGASSTSLLTDGSGNLSWGNYRATPLGDDGLVTIVSTTVETEVFSHTIASSTLGNNGHIRVRVPVKSFGMDGTAGVLTVRFKLGASTLGSFTVGRSAESPAIPLNDTLLYKGYFDVEFWNTGTESSQRGMITTQLINQADNTTVLKTINTPIGTSVDTSSSVDFVMTGQWNSSDTQNDVDFGGANPILTPSQ